LTKYVGQMRQITSKEVCMRLSEVMAITQAECLLPDIDLDREVHGAFASDLMSDVLRYDLADGLLITGLANPQAIRTAEMADATAVLLARGKVPSPEMIHLAEETDIPLLSTHITMFETCGRLHVAGLPAATPHNGRA
jgi:predicted transcriptional regulator